MNSEKTKNSLSLRGDFVLSGKFQRNFDQGKANLVRVISRELSKFELSRFYCTSTRISKLM